MPSGKERSVPPPSAGRDRPADAPASAPPPVSAGPSVASASASQAKGKQIMSPEARTRVWSKWIQATRTKLQKTQPDASAKLERMITLFNEGGRPMRVETLLKLMFEVAPSTKPEAAAFAEHLKSGRVDLLEYIKQLRETVSEEDAGIAEKDSVIDRIATQLADQEAENARLRAQLDAKKTDDSAAQTTSHAGIGSDASASAALPCGSDRTAIAAQPVVPAAAQRAPTNHTHFPLLTLEDCFKFVSKGKTLEEIGEDLLKLVERKPVPYKSRKISFDPANYEDKLPKPKYDLPLLQLVCNFADGDVDETSSRDLVYEYADWSTVYVHHPIVFLLALIAANPATSAEFAQRAHWALGYRGPDGFNLVFEHLVTLIRRRLDPTDERTTSHSRRSKYPVSAAIVYTPRARDFFGRIASRQMFAVFLDAALSLGIELRFEQGQVRTFIEAWGADRVKTQLAAPPCLILQGHQRDKKMFFSREKQDAAESYVVAAAGKDMSPDTWKGYLNLKLEDGFPRYTIDTAIPKNVGLHVNVRSWFIPATKDSEAKLLWPLPRNSAGHIARLPQAIDAKAHHHDDEDRPTPIADAASSASESDTPIADAAAEEADSVHGSKKRSSSERDALDRDDSGRPKKKANTTETAYHKCQRKGCEKMGYYRSKYQKPIMVQGVPIQKMFILCDEHNSYQFDDPCVVHTCSAPAVGEHAQLCKLHNAIGGNMAAHVPEGYSLLDRADNDGRILDQDTSYEDLPEKLQKRTVFVEWLQGYGASCQIIDAQVRVPEHFTVGQAVALLLKKRAGRNARSRGEDTSTARIDWTEIAKNKDNDIAMMSPAIEVDRMFNQLRSDEGFPSAKLPRVSLDSIIGGVAAHTAGVYSDGVRVVRFWNSRPWGKPEEPVVHVSSDGIASTQLTEHPDTDYALLNCVSLTFDRYPHSVVTLCAYPQHDGYVNGEPSPDFPHDPTNFRP